MSDRTLDQGGRRMYDREAIMFARGLCLLCGARRDMRLAVADHHRCDHEEILRAAYLPSAD